MVQRNLQSSYVLGCEFESPQWTIPTYAWLALSSHLGFYWYPSEMESNYGSVEFKGVPVILIV